jgi:hypothetical protein
MGKWVPAGQGGGGVEGKSDIVMSKGYRVALGGMVEMSRKCYNLSTNNK